MAPTSVTSNPSMIQVIPSAMTTFQCHGPQGSRSILAGMSVLIGAAVPEEVFIASPSGWCSRVWFEEVRSRPRAEGEGRTARLDLSGGSGIASRHEPV